MEDRLKYIEKTMDILIKEVQKLNMKVNEIDNMIRQTPIMYGDA